MIPASSIHFNDDGTAWWVRDDALPDSPSGWPITANDRPCDSCGGDEWMIEPDGNDPGCHCDACVNGRHTFTVEVETLVYVEPYGEALLTRTLRVSIREGMVLPIYHEWDGRDPITQDAPPCIYPSEDGQWWIDYGTVGVLDTLPPDAQPGMWAVQLQVHQNGENQ